MTIPNNKTFCGLPFTHSYIGPHYERHLCCVSDELPELKKTTMIQFWNSKKMSEIRLKMIAGEPVKECHRCYEYEKKGLSSLRIDATYKNNPDLQDAIDTMDSAGNLVAFPTYFDHRTIHCNLQCLSCGDDYSSTHIKLKHQMAQTPIETKFDHEYEILTANDIILALDHKHCKSIYWAGGEPMTSHVHWAVVDRMYQLSQVSEYQEYIKGISVMYNTNMTKSVWKGKQIPDLLEFYQPSIRASIDGVEETFDYCRDGASWSEVKHNWDMYYQKLNVNRQMGVSAVLSAPVMMDIDRFLNFFENYDIQLYNHKYVVDADSYPYGSGGFLDIRLFPKHICDRVINNAAERFSKSPLNGSSASIDIVRSYLAERDARDEYFSNITLLRNIKRRTAYRNQFLKTSRPFEELLKLIDKEAYEWFMSI